MRSCFTFFRAKFYNPILRLTLQQYRLVRGDKSELIICLRVISCENCEIRHSKKLLWPKKFSHDMWWVGIGRSGITIFIFWKPRDLDNIMINNPTIVIPFFLNDLPYFSAFVTNISMLTLLFFSYIWHNISTSNQKLFKKWREVK